MILHKTYKLLHSVSLPESLVLLVESVDAVNHLLDQLDLAVAQPVLVGDVVGDASLAAGLSPGAPGLQVQLLAPGCQGLQTLLGPAGQVDVDGGPHAGSQVGWAGVDVTVLGVKHEVLSRLCLNTVFDGLDATGKAIKDSPDISSHLHGDDTELILLVDPGEEGLVLVVEDAATLGPVALHAGDLQVRVAGHEKEVVVYKLLSYFLVHTSERIVTSCEVILKVGESLLHEVLNSNPLLLGDSRGKAESVDGTTNPDPAG